MTNKKTLKKYGWVPDLPDHRDLKFSARITAPVQLPPSADLRPSMPAVYNQYDLGSCTANATGAALQYDQIKQKEESFVPSRLFIYYNTRSIEGTVKQDAGAQIRDAVKSAIKYGGPNEKLWPYEIKKFAQKPPSKAYTDGAKHQAVAYFRVNNTEYELKKGLAEGFPVIFGFSVYESFESNEVAKTGIVPMPKTNEKNLGGHAVLLVGYDDAKKMFIVRNSWGEEWGDGGYCYMPYEFITNSDLCDDFWTIRRVE